MQIGKILRDFDQVLYYLCSLFEKKAHSFYKHLTLHLPFVLFFIEHSEGERLFEPNLPFFLSRTSNSFTPLLSFVGVYHKQRSKS